MQSCYFVWDSDCGSWVKQFYMPHPELWLKIGLGTCRLMQPNCFPLQSMHKAHALDIVMPIAQLCLKKVPSQTHTELACLIAAWGTD